MPDRAAGSAGPDPIPPSPLPQTHALVIRPRAALPRTVSGRSVFAHGLAACALAACLAACATTPPATTTTAHSPDTSAGAVSAYRAMWADLVSAARTSDFQSSRLSRHATGQTLSIFVQGLARDRLHGIVTRGAPAISPVVTSYSPTRVTIEDCFDDTHWLEYKTSGGRAKNTPGGRRSTTAHLVRTSGTWKVSGLTIGKTGTC